MSVDTRFEWFMKSYWLDEDKKAKYRAEFEKLAPGTYRDADKLFKKIEEEICWKQRYRPAPTAEEVLN